MPAQGIFSSRKIAERLRRDAHFMYLSSDKRPTFTLSTTFAKTISTCCLKARLKATRAELDAEIDRCIEPYRAEVERLTQIPGVKKRLNV